MHPKDIIDQDEDELTHKQIKSVADMFKNLNFDWPRREEPYGKADYYHWISSLTDNDKTNLQKDLNEVCEKSLNDVKKDGYINENDIFDEVSYIEDFNSAVSQVEERVRSGNRRALDDMKEPVQFPLIFPLAKENTISLSKLPRLQYIDSNHYLAIVWNSVFEALNYNSISSVDYKEESLTNIPWVNTRDSPPSKNTLYLKFDKSVELELAKAGIFAKAYKHHPDYIADQLRSNAPFSIDCNTDDIENFICGNDGDAIFEPSSEINEINSLIEKVMEFSWNLHGNKGGDRKAAYRTFINSKLGRFCSFVSNVAEELADSLTKKLEPHQYIIKTLRHQQCLMLIANSDCERSESYLFITFCFKKDWLEDSFILSTNAFKNFFELGDYYITRFSSFNDAKLFNLARCEAIMFNVSCYFQAANGIEYWRKGKNIFSHSYDDVSSQNIFEAKSMIKFCLVVLLNDKRRTDELLSLFRYAMLTGLQEKPLLPNPHKMFYKITGSLRSRIQIWVVKKLIAASEKLIKHRGFQRTMPNNNDNDKTRYTNLFNPFNFNEIEDFDYLISLFYCGYLKNKNEKPEHNGKIGIYRNILEFENKLPKNYNYLSQGSFGIDSIERHNFSSRMLKHIIDSVKERLNSRYGSHWEESVVNDFLKTISTTTIDQFATLKSSSAFSNESYHIRENHSKSTIFQELFKIVGEGEDNIYISDLAIKSLNHIEKNGCLHTEVFQKPQHGSIREIYVLGIHERIVQHIIETLARTICNLFCSEIITHPENKFSIPKNHYRAAETEFGAKYQTMAASCDAEKWNQNHYVSKFAFLLCRMTSNSKFLHPFIVRVLSYWKHKRIMIDPEILTYFDRIYGDIVHKDSTIRAMFNAYKGKEQQPWAKLSRVGYIETESGMMQGILHDTSSLLHTVLQEYLKSFLTQFLTSQLKKSYGRKEKVIIDNQQSSDDSSMMISFKADTENKIEENLLLSGWAFKIKANIGYLVGIWKSPKTIENCCFFMEFNSEYFFNGELYRPTLREIISSVLISETDSLYRRQDVMSTALTDIIECGGSYMLTSMCQIGQCIQFYRFLGSNFSPVFSTWIRKLMDFPDPGLGFFLMDNPLCGGLLGMKYNVWNLVYSNKKISSAYASIVANTMTKMRGNNKEAKLSAINGDDDWMLNPGSFATQHGKSRIGKIFNEVIHPNNLDGWREKLNDDHPDLYYCPARNGLETRLKMLAKLNMVNAEKMLSARSSVIRSLIPDLYSLTHKIFCNSEFGCFVTERDNQMKYTRISLSELLNSCLKKDYKGEMTDGILNQIFPHHKSFREIWTCLKSLKYDLTDAVEIPRRRKKELGEIIVTVDRTEPNAISPMRILRRMWYGRPNRNVANIFLKMFGEMKLTYPWIRNTQLDSFRQAPFSKSFHMANFCKKLEAEGRTVSITGSAVLGNNILANISNSVINDYSESHVLKIVPSISKSIYHCEPYKILKHAILMIVSSFASHDVKLSLLINIFQNEELELSKLKEYKRFNSLYVLKRFLVCDDSEIKINQLLLDVKQHELGYFGGFNENENKSCTASWSGMFDGNLVEIHVVKDCNELKISKIVVTSTDNFPHILRYLKIWAVDHNVSNAFLKSSVPKVGEGERMIVYIIDFTVSSEHAHAAIFCTTNKKIVVGNCQPINTYVNIDNECVCIMGTIKTSAFANVDNANKVTKSKYFYIKAKEITVTLLSYKADMSDYISDPSSLPSLHYLSSGWRKWIRNEEYSRIEINALNLSSLNLHENIVLKKAFKTSLIKFELLKRPFSDMDKANKDENKFYNENALQNLKQIHCRLKCGISPVVISSATFSLDKKFARDPDTYLSNFKNKYVVDVASCSVIFDRLLKNIIGYKEKPGIFNDIKKCLAGRLPDDIFQQINKIVDISKAMETYCCISENSCESTDGDPFSVSLGS